MSFSEFLGSVQENMNKKIWAIVLALIGTIVTIGFAIYTAGGDSVKYKLAESQETSKNKTDLILNTQRNKIFNSSRQDIESLQNERQKMLDKYNS